MVHEHSEEAGKKAFLPRFTYSLRSLLTVIKIVLFGMKLWPQKYNKRAGIFYYYSMLPKNLFLPFFMNLCCH